MSSYPSAAGPSSSPPLPPHLDPLFAAQAAFRRRDFDRCLSLCTALLAASPFDQAVWLLKCRALTARGFVDDVEVDDEGIAEVLLDDNAVAQAPRPGTSLRRPGTSAAGGGASSSAQSARSALDAAVRPMTASGRPVTGFARPGTSYKGSSSGGVGGVGGRGMTSSVDAAFRSGRAGTARALTALGRAVRLGTASLLSAPGGPFLDASRLDLRKYAARPALGKALCDYLLYVDHDPQRAMELAALATVAAGYEDWMWKERLGKAYFQLGLLRDAEAQFRSSLRIMETATAYAQLARVYVRLDQPAAALDVFRRGSAAFPGDVGLLVGGARIHDEMGNTELASAAYKRALAVDAGCAEAIACLASHAFYADQPEVALKYYRRLLQMGGGGGSGGAGGGAGGTGGASTGGGAGLTGSVELWTNLGLVTFYASQYDLSLSCLCRAIALAEDDTAGDVWYTVGVVAVGLGDTGLAYQAFQVALALDPAHAESHVNLGVLEVRRGNAAAGVAHFTSAQRAADYLYEAWFNGALASQRAGDLQAAHAQCKRALEAFPDHADSMELMRGLKAQFVQA
jgi:tetratricopeptide repeat protein 8